MIYRRKEAGFTIIELLIGIAIFAIVSVGIFLSYSNLINIIVSTRLNAVAISILETEIEVMRSMPYQDIGTQGGIPAGVLPAQKTINNFEIQTFIRNVDDPFDGVLGGTPDDTTPADYKIVEVEASCSQCPRFKPVKLTTTIAPKGLEGFVNSGTLFINVFNVLGQPVSGADVTVINNAVSPPVSINDVTDVNGVLKLIDAPPSANSYEITATKNGYTIDQTYPFGAPSNPNPVKPHATVIAQEVTEIGFQIDRVSALNFKTKDQMCSAIPGVAFRQMGQKLIGASPDVLKFDLTSTTDASGEANMTNLEWDTYQFSNVDTTYDIVGMSNPLTLVVNPASSYGIDWVMQLKKPQTLLVTVEDSSGAPLNDASVSLTLGGFNEEKLTGRSIVAETDWSSGNYNSISSNIEVNNPAGEIALVSVGGVYASMSQEWLISSTIDFGTAQTTFYDLSWNPQTQPPQTGADSLKVQIATNNDDATWNFVGPDGTSSTFYTASDTQLHSSHNGDRFMRYKIFLHTEDENFTPTLEDIQIKFTSSCLMDGQTSFDSLVGGTYTLTINKSGFQTFTDTNVSISTDWQEYTAVLAP